MKTGRPTHSFWQRGCDDAKAGSSMILPNPGRQQFDPLNIGYINGFYEGLKIRDTNLRTLKAIDD